jgi:signal transduction histidine kinase
LNSAAGSHIVRAQLRQMDGLLQGILDSAPAGIVCLDLESRILFANPFVARMLGCSSADDLIGQPIHSYIQFFTLAATGADTCIREDGTSFPIEYESAPLVEAGKTAGIVVTLRDISERRAAARLQAELISVVSHELRTPLTSIRSALGLLASGHLGELPRKAQRMVDIAVTNSDRLIRLINHTLDLERVESGDMRIAHAACDAGELMQHAADTVRAVADNARVVLDVTPVAATLSGDADRLQQVLINLLANAIKFSPASGGTVWLDAEQSPGELVFRVRDEGRGIPADKLETIFKRFAQVDETDRREKGGTGLGLAICRAIVEQHGGQIWAESTPGAGTTLCVALPCEDRAHVGERQAA